MEEEEEDAERRGKGRHVAYRGRSEGDKGEKGRQTERKMGEGERERNRRVNTVKNGKQYIMVKE